MSYVYIVLFIFSTVFTIVLFQEVTEEGLWGLVSLFLAALFLSLMFDIHGVQIDLNRESIITYKKVLWFRISKRYNLTDFKTITITKDSVYVRASRWSDHGGDNYYYYYLNLGCPVRNQTIILAESEDYNEIVLASEGLQLMLDLEVWDGVYGLG